jgi:predicted anti-sigma-YlaC factor YlaD
MGNGRSIRTASCERTRVAAALEVDGALSQLELAVLDAHVARCADCHAFRREIAELTAALRDAPAVPFRAQLILPHRRRIGSVAMRAAAVAATIAVTMISFSTATNVEHSASPKRVVAPSGTYQQSMDYERDLMRRILDPNKNARLRLAI